MPPLNSLIYTFLVGLFVLAAISKVFLMLMGNKSFTGAYGEYLTCKKLKKLTTIPLIKNPILVNSKGESCEIDIIMLHPTGIYVFESKNYSGWIFGRESQYKWTQSLNKKTKRQFYNPIMQNKKHIDTLSEISGTSSLYFSSIIVFSDRCKLKKLEIHSDTIVDNRGNAIKELESRIAKKVPIYSEPQLKGMYDAIMSKAKFDRKSRQEHIKSIKAKYSK